MESFHGGDREEYEVAGCQIIGNRRVIGDIQVIYYTEVTPHGLPLLAAKEAPNLFH